MRSSVKAWLTWKCWSDAAADWLNTVVAGCPAVAAPIWSDAAPVCCAAVTRLNVSTRCCVESSSSRSLRIWEVFFKAGRSPGRFFNRYSSGVSRSTKFPSFPCAADFVSKSPACSCIMRFCSKGSGIGIFFSRTGFRSRSSSNATFGISSLWRSASATVSRTIRNTCSPFWKRSSILVGWTLTSRNSGSILKCSMVNGYLCCIINGL